MRCAITQPTFLPWLGWFDLIDNVDAVVLLDTVQFEKRSWQQRNRIKTDDGLQFITVPVQSSGRFEQKIKDVKIAEEFSPTSILGKIKSHYSTAPYFVPVFKEVKDILMDTHAGDELLTLNLKLIEYFFTILKISTPVIKASELKVSGTRGEYLANICSNIGASTYVSTLGARDYLLKDLQYFVNNDVGVLLYEFESQTYPQLYSPFVHQASTLDLVMMVGPDCGQIMRSGIRVLSELISNP